MSSHIIISDYSRYFSPMQKVHLVNMTVERESGIYESLSGIVTATGINTLEVLINHERHGAGDSENGTATYKLTSESLGSGIHVLADLAGVVGQSLHFCLHGSLEMFQRRIATRVALSTKIFHLHGAFPLDFFRKEWTRVMEFIRNNGELPGLDLRETEINLSSGGIGLTLDVVNPSSPLSIFFVTLDGGLPICALAETVWEKRLDSRLRCGFRYINILKADQERINGHISEVTRNR
jgi:hypothetical protein